MYTRDQIIEIIEQKIQDETWCENGARDAIQLLSQFPTNIPYQELVSKIGNAAYLYYWGRDISPDNDIRKALIKTGHTKYLHCWGQYISLDDDIKKALIKTGDVRHM